MCAKIQNHPFHRFRSIRQLTVYPSPGPELMLFYLKVIFYTDENSPQMYESKVRWLVMVIVCNLIWVTVVLELELCQSNADLATASNPNLARLTTDELGGSGELTMCPPRHGSSTICAVRDRSSAQATISYKELHVLPFCHYEHFRRVSSFALLKIPCPFIWCVYMLYSENLSHSIGTWGSS